MNSELYQWQRHHSTVCVLKFCVGLVRVNIQLLQTESYGDALSRQAGHVTVRQVLSQEPPASTGGFCRTQQTCRHHEHVAQPNALPEGCAVRTSGIGTGRRAAVRIHASTHPVRQGISQSFDQPTDQRLAGKQGHARRLRRVMSRRSSVYWYCDVEAQQTQEPPRASPHPIHQSAPPHPTPYTHTIK